jgi:uncharacterized membrane protein (UPF0127 family)
MKAYKCQSSKLREMISGQVFIADNFIRRFSGLLFRKPLKSDEVFILKDCKSIHTMGMRYSLDAAFLDEGGKIIAVFEDLCPWRFTPYIREAVSVMETASGFLRKRSLKVGDRIIFE